MYIYTVIIATLQIYTFLPWYIYDVGYFRVWMCKFETFFYYIYSDTNALKQINNNILVNQRGLLLFGSIRTLPKRLHGWGGTVAVGNILEMSHLTFFPYCIEDINNGAY